MKFFIFRHPQLGLLRSGGEIHTVSYQQAADELVQTLQNQSPDWRTHQLTPAEQKAFVLSGYKSISG